MSNLTGQQIQNTYDGLLNLQDSTTGITTTLQAVQDGLGNNTGSRIAVDSFIAPNLVNFYYNKQKPKYMGNGVSASASYNPGSSSQNNMVWTYFYDTGVHDYSAITYSIGTQTTTDDTLNVSFYDLQYVDEYGWFPNNLIMSGISLTTTSTGRKTTTLPSTLSFSGLGGGFYAILLVYRNPTSVAPTVRISLPVATVNNQSYVFQFGFVRNQADTSFQYGNRAGAFVGNTSYWLTGNPLEVFTPADIISKYNTTIPSNSPGFMLDVIK